MNILNYNNRVLPNILWLKFRNVFIVVHRAVFICAPDNVALHFNLFYKPRNWKKYLPLLTLMIIIVIENLSLW